MNHPTNQAAVATGLVWCMRRQCSGMSAVQCKKLALRGTRSPVAAFAKQTFAPFYSKGIVLTNSFGFGTIEIGIWIGLLGLNTT